MERVKFLKHNGNILPFMFDYNMTSEMIEKWLLANKGDLFSILDLCEEHSCTISAIDKYVIYISGDEDGVSLLIDYTQVIKHNWL